MCGSNCTEGSNPSLSACFYEPPPDEHVKGFSTSESRSMLMAGCSTIPHELTQLLSLSDYLRFESRPPFRRSVNKPLSCIHPSRGLRTPRPGLLITCV